MKQPVVLLYQIPPQEKIKIMQVLQRYRCQGIAVETEQYATPLGVLAGETRAEGAAPVYTGSPLPEPVMVFCNCGDTLLDNLLSALRQAQVPGILKAVLTPTNQSWTAGMLYFELAKERQVFLQRKKKSF